MNNQRQVALALLNYEKAHARFPGYVNRIPRADDDPVVASWVVLLFPYLERNDLAKLWREGNRQAVYMQVMTCPRDPPAEPSAGTPFLGYVVNCGRPGDSGSAADGVFHNHNLDADPVDVSLEFINQHDGAETTLMFSENIQAGLWTDTGEADLGMVWRPVPGPCSPINQCRDAGDRPQDIRYARPSSNHSGGVVASFCDGHLQFLSEDVDYGVFQHLMTPDGKGAGLSGPPNPAQP